MYVSPPVMSPEGGQAQMKLCESIISTLGLSSKLDVRVLVCQIASERYKGMGSGRRGKDGKGVEVLGLGKKNFKCMAWTECYEGIRSVNTDMLCVAYL
jgi:hypothetical protein